MGCFLFFFSSLFSSLIFSSLLFSLLHSSSRSVPVPSAPSSPCKLSGSSELPAQWRRDPELPLTVTVGVLVGLEGSSLSSPKVDIRGTPCRDRNFLSMATILGWLHRTASWRGVFPHRSSTSRSPC